MSLVPSTSPGTDWREVAINLGRYARGVYDDRKDAETDAFALGLAAEKAARKVLVPAPISGTARGRGRTTSAKVKGKSKGKKNKGGVVSGISADLAVGPSLNIPPKSIPGFLQIVNQIVWWRPKFNLATVSTSTTVITELNVQFLLNVAPNFAAYNARWDQYCIVAAQVDMEVLYPPGSTQAAGQIYSAIDFDNVSVLGTIAAIEGYSTCKVRNVSSNGMVVSRACKPCVAEEAGVQTQSTVERRWVDSAFPGIPHYGLRFLASVTGVVVQLVPVVTYWVAFRGQI